MSCAYWVALIFQIGRELEVILPFLNAWKWESGSRFCYEVLWKFWGG